DDVGAPLAPPRPQNIGAFARHTSARSTGVTTPTGGAPAHSTAAVAAHEDGPLALGHARASLDGMADSGRYRQTGVRHRLAPTRLSTVVGLEEPPPDGATGCAGRHPFADSHDGAGEPALGCAADPWRTAQTRNRCV